MSLEATSFWKIKNKCVKQFEPLSNAVTRVIVCDDLLLLETGQCRKEKLPT